MSRRTHLLLVLACTVLSAWVAPGAIGCLRAALDPAQRALDVRPALPLDELSAQR